MKLFLPIVGVVFMITIAGCDTISRLPDRVGSHMPVVGERCEYWQCFTEYGRQQSEMKKRMMAEESASKEPPKTTLPESANIPSDKINIPPTRKPVPQREP